MVASQNSPTLHSRTVSSGMVITGIVVLAVVVRLLYLLLIRQGDASSLDNGDYTLYEIGARHILTTGRFDNSLFLARPPLFPLLIALLEVQASRVLLLNAVLGGLTSGLVYGIGRQLRLPTVVSMGAALWFALDPKAIDKGAVLLDPVPLSVIGITGMVFCLMGLVNAASLRRALWWGLAAAGLFALAVLSRPESFLLWTGLGGLLLLLARRWWPAVLLYMGLCALVVGGWMLHNGQVFNYATFSTVSPFTLAYYRAASVERLATADDIDTVYLNITRRVEQQLGHDPALVTEDTRWGYHAATPAMAAALTDVSLAIFRAHPREYVITMGVGALRMYGLLPEGDGLSAWLLAAYNGVLVLLAFIGWGMLVQRRQWQSVLWVLLLVGYYTVGVLLVKNAALEGRERAVLNPYLTLCASIAVYALWQRWQRRPSAVATAASQ